MVFSDSRGRPLNDYLDERIILVQAFGGYKLLDIVEETRSYINDFHPTCVLYVAGTCDLTTKDKATKLIKPSFPSYVDLCTHMMTTFKMARTRATELFPQLKVAFGGLCGVNLNRYNKQAHIDPLQPIINDTVDTLNYAIRAENILHGLHHPTLTSKIHLKRKGKKQRNQYRLLWDGVHLSQPALRDWAVNITKFHHNVHTHGARVAEATCPPSSDYDVHLDTEIKYNLVEPSHLDVYCFTESWLKPDNNSDLFEINDYNMIRADRTLLTASGNYTHGGGIICFIREDLHYNTLNYSHLTCDLE